VLNPPSPSLRPHVPFIVIFLLIGVLYFATIRPGHDWGGDFSVYLNQARNVAAGVPFTTSTYVPTEESLRHQPAVYPPLTSLILAPVYARAGMDYSAFKTVLNLFLWLSLPVYYVFGIQRGLSPAVAAVIVIIFALSSHILAVRQMIGSDMVYLWLSGVALIFFTAVYQRGWDRAMPVRVAAGAAALLILCYLSRAAGLILIAGFAVHEAWRARRPRLFGIVTLGIVGAALLVYARLAFDPGQQYGRQFPVRPLAAYIENALHYLRTPAAFWGGAPAVLRYGLAAVTLALAAAGFVRRLRRPEITEAYVLVSAAVLMAYSLAADTRYVLPLLPLLLMYAAEGLIWASKGRKPVLVSCAAIAFGASMFNLRAMETGPIREGIAEPSFTAVCSYIRQNTPSDALLVSWNPRVFALYTGRNSALYTKTANPAAFTAGLPPGKPALLIVYSREENHELLKRVVAALQPAPPLVFDNSDFRIYQLR
jgi:hypothetical protein